MHFGLSPEQQELASTVRALLAKHADSAATRTAADSAEGYDLRLWRILADQIGVAALAVPEELGGAGCGFFETAVVLEEIGRSLAPSPLLPSAVVTEALLAAGGPVAVELLPRVAAGEVATILWGGTAEERDGGWSMTGTVERVPFGQHAAVLLAVATTSDGQALVAVDPAQASIIPTPSLDPTSVLASVTVDSPALLLSTDPDVLGHVRRAHTAALVMLQLGCAQRGLDLTVEHVQQRVQFGRRIGSFQAVKHRLAELLVLVETLRSAAWAAAYAVATRSPDAALLVPVAAAYAGDALERVASETVQLHGGIGITWEHDAHLVLKRAQVLRQLSGTPAHHRAAVLTP